MSARENQRILPPWLQGAISATDGDDQSVDYGSSSVASEEYDSSDEDSSNIELGYWKKEEEDKEPGFIQVHIEWSQLFGDITHGDNSFVEVMQGPNLNMLQLFMEELPPPPSPLALAAAKKSQSSHEDGNNSHIMSEIDIEETQNRPIVDTRRSSPANKQKDYILWNDMFEFERLRSEMPTDEVELYQRESEEKRILFDLERCGHLGRKGIVSSSEFANQQEFSLDVIDAEAMVLLRLCSSGDTGGETVIGQCLIVIDSLRRIAVPDEADMLFSSHHLHAKSGFDVGIVRVGLRFRLPHELEFNHVKNREYFEEELMTETLFEKYDTNGDGYLTRKEFMNFVRELSNVGGNINQLEECDNGGGRCLGSCIPLPSMDLFSYIKHNHTLLVVCFDQPKYMRKHVASTKWERLGFVLMSLLWSLSVNCLVEIYMETSRFWQVLTITLVDSCGKSLMNSFFIIAHLRCWSKAYHRCLGMAGTKNTLPSQNTCEMLSLLVFIVFLIFFATWLLLAMSPEQLYSSGYSFIPIWSVSRVTEIFYWGTAWAFMVQYGTSHSAASTRWHQDRRDKDREKERWRRSHMMNEKQWWQISVPDVNWALPANSSLSARPT